MPPPYLLLIPANHQSVYIGNSLKIFFISSPNKILLLTLSLSLGLSDFGTLLLFSSHTSCFHKDRRAGGKHYNNFICFQEGCFHKTQFIRVVSKSSPLSLCSPSFMHHSNRPLRGRCFLSQPNTLWKWRPNCSEKIILWVHNDLLMESQELMQTASQIAASQFQEEPRSKSLLFPLLPPHLMLKRILFTAYNVLILLVTTNSTVSSFV